MSIPRDYCRRPFFGSYESSTPAKDSCIVRNQTWLWPIVNRALRRPEHVSTTDKDLSTRDGLLYAESVPVDVAASSPPGSSGTRRRRDGRVASVPIGGGAPVRSRARKAVDDLLIRLYCPNTNRHFSRIYGVSSTQCLLSRIPSKNVL